MAYQNSTVPFEKMLMKFVLDEDPMLSMLKWIYERLMEADLGAKNPSVVEAAKDIVLAIGFAASTHEWGRCI